MTLSTQWNGLLRCNDDCDRRDCNYARRTLKCPLSDCSETNYLCSRDLVLSPKEISANN